MDKKGDFSWEQLGKILLAVVFFLVLLIIIGLFITKGNTLFDKIENFVRFGR